MLPEIDSWAIEIEPHTLCAVQRENHTSPYIECKYECAANRETLKSSLQLSFVRLSLVMVWACICIHFWCIFYLIVLYFIPISHQFTKSHWYVQHMWQQMASDCGCDPCLRDSRHAMGIVGWSVWIGAKCSQLHWFESRHGPVLFLSRADLKINSVPSVHRQVMEIDGCFPCGSLCFQGARVVPRWTDGCFVPACVCARIRERKEEWHTWITDVYRSLE